MDALCWTEPFVWHGQCYDITVSRQTGGKCYTAETVLGPGDKVISDGRSVEDAVEQLRDVLPVAFGAWCGGCSWAILKCQMGILAWLPGLAGPRSRGDCREAAWCVSPLTCRHSRLCVVLHTLVYCSSPTYWHCYASRTI
jgi:hypothetical protein